LRIKTLPPESPAVGPGQFAVIGHALKRPAGVAALRQLIPTSGVRRCTETPKRSPALRAAFAHKPTRSFLGPTATEFHGWYSSMDVPLDTEDEGHVASAAEGS